jgi:hypothetical protein
MQFDLLTYIPTESERAPPPKPDRVVAERALRDTRKGSPLRNWLNEQVSYYRRLQIKIMQNSSRAVLAGGSNPAREAMRKYAIGDLQVRVDRVLERLKELEEERDRL